MAGGGMVNVFADDDITVLCLFSSIYVKAGSAPHSFDFVRIHIVTIYAYRFIVF